MEPGGTVWSLRVRENWGAPCSLSSSDCRACSASGLRGESVMEDRPKAGVITETVRLMGLTAGKETEVVGFDTE